MNEMNLTEFTNGVIEAVNEIAAEFSTPDADFLPFMHMANNHDVVVVAIDGHFLGSEMLKDFLVYNILTPVIKGFGATRVVTVLSAWQAELSDEDRKRFELDTKEIPPPSEMPNREEIVIVMAYDGTETITKQAPILRDGKNPPTLGEWREDYRGEAMTGRFISPLRDALRESTGEPDAEFMAAMEEHRAD